MSELSQPGSVATDAKFADRPVDAVPVRFHILASGSSGNASLLQVGDRRLLLDGGLPPTRLKSLLAEVGVDWTGIHAFLLTHTHSDHWHPGVIQQLWERRIPLFCHGSHRKALQAGAPDFVSLGFAGLLRYFETGRCFDPLPGVRCRPLAIPHDGGATFGFRFDGSGWGVAYAADLGSWDRQLAPAFADVDLLALEFNHDLDLQRASRRPGWLVNRVLGDHGHLSNHQGARLLKECIQASVQRPPRHVVQLHLSKDCNTPELASAAAQAILDEFAVRATLHTTWQGARGPSIHIT
ncbi:MAG TPA: MBL fold metallo-hydrolase [Planctomycetaceae bacterium]|jgi:phosphoribosyl 1,2-cyclic phosphodiesterase|nr:MBL fold metallo-hydrolase [Planctomycetaceae bacterium]